MQHFIRATRAPNFVKLKPSRYFCALISIFVFFNVAVADSKPQSFPAFANAYAKAHDFNGRVLLQHKGKILLDRAFGLANREQAAPTKMQTKYKIASITKMFTAVLILQLRDSGQLDLDATIDQYLPNYTGPAASQVSVRQLLTHTSGMHNVDAEPMPAGVSPYEAGLAQYQLPASTDNLLKRFYSQKLAAKPGAKFDYNNADYFLLGKIVEAITKKTFEAALQEHVLTPLKMRSSGMLRQTAIIPELANTYFFREDIHALTPDLPVYMENWYAAGAMYSTASDLLKFANALYLGKLIKPDSLKLMLTPGLDDYGFGLWIDALKSKSGKAVQAFRRPGQIMGAQTMLIYYQQADLIVIVLSNTGNASPDEFAFALGRKVLDAM
jgi:D-alanyl-D-alanine carboxypeptidase